MKNTFHSHGVVALVTVLLLGAVLTEIALAGIFVVYVLNNSSFGLRLSSDALAASQSGIDDALLNLLRDKDFAYSSSPFVLILSSRASADITLVNSPCGALLTPKQATITSLGRAGLQRRQLEATVAVDCATGEVRVALIKEISAS